MWSYKALCEYPVFVWRRAGRWQQGRTEGATSRVALHTSSAAEKKGLFPGAVVCHVNGAQFLRHVAQERARFLTSPVISMAVSLRTYVLPHAQILFVAAQRMALKARLEADFASLKVKCELASRAFSWLERCES